MGGTPFLGRKLKGTSRNKRDAHVNRVECHQRTPILLQGQPLKSSASAADSVLTGSSSSKSTKAKIFENILCQVVTEELVIRQSYRPGENALQALWTGTPHFPRDWSCADPAV
jgi:hypothetical protein